MVKESVLEERAGRNVPLKSRLMSKGSKEDMKVATGVGQKPSLDLTGLSRAGISPRFRVPQTLSDGLVHMPRNSVWTWRLLFVVLACVDEDPEVALSRTFVIPFSDLMAAFGRPGIRNYKQIRESIKDLSEMQVELTDGKRVRMHLSQEVAGHAWEFYPGPDLIDLYRDVDIYTRVHFDEVFCLKTNLDHILYLRAKRVWRMRSPTASVEVAHLALALPGRQTEQGQLARAIRTSIEKLALTLGEQVAYKLETGGETRRLQSLTISRIDVLVTNHQGMNESKSVPRVGVVDETLSISAKGSTVPC